MYDIFSGQVGNGLWDLPLELSQENIFLDREGLRRKYMYRRRLEGLVVARIISFTWYLKYKQTVSRISLCGSTAARIAFPGGGR